MTNRTLAEVGSAHDGRVRIYSEENEVGGRRYWSDSIGGGVVIWDTSLVSPEELAICLGIEEKSRTQEEEQRMRTEDELEKRRCPDSPA